jgi:hypothetical protein
MRTNRLLALAAAAAIAVAPLAVGTAAQADDHGKGNSASAGKPENPGDHGKAKGKDKFGLTKLAFVGTGSERTVDLAAGDVVVKVKAQIKDRSKKEAASVAAHWTLDGVEQADLALPDRKGKSKVVGNWRADLPLTAESATGEYCLTGVAVTPEDGSAVVELDTSKLNKGQAKKTCFTVVNTTPAA